MSAMPNEIVRNRKTLTLTINRSVNAIGYNHDFAWQSAFYQCFAFPRSMITDRCFAEVDRLASSAMYRFRA